CRARWPGPAQQGGRILTAAKIAGRLSCGIVTHKPTRRSVETAGCLAFRRFRPRSTGLRPDTKTPRQGPDTTVAMSTPRSPIILIPARLAAARLPDKPLADLHGVPMIVQVWRRAMEADIGPVAVAAAETAIV